MTGRPFSLANCEATFGPENWNHMGRKVADAPPFSPEQIERFKALFASARVMRPADSGADAA